VVIWQKGRIATAHGRFNHVRQVAPMAPPIQCMLPWTHRSPHPKRNVDRFSHFCTVHCRQSLYLIMGRPFPLKIALCRGSGRPSNLPARLCHMVLGLTRVHNPNGMSIGSAVLHDTRSSVRQTDRQTDHATPSVTIGRIYLRSTAMRTKNNQNVGQCPT